MGCKKEHMQLKVAVYETSARGNKLTQILPGSSVKKASIIKLLPSEKFQTITGFGGSFTEASAYLLNQLSKKNRNRRLRAYCGEEGARYYSYYQRGHGTIEGRIQNFVLSMDCTSLDER